MERLFQNFVTVKNSCDRGMSFVYYEKLVLDQPVRSLTFHASL